MIVKSLVSARDILLEELQRLGKAIDKTVDLTDFISKMDDIKLFELILEANLGAPDGEVSRPGKPQNDLEVLTYFMHHSTSGFLFNFYAEFCLLNLSLFLSRKQMVFQTFTLMTGYQLYPLMLY